MKLTAEEKRTVAALRELDSNQRDDIIAYINRQVLANRITARVSGVPELSTVSNRKVERAYGPAPAARPLRGRPK